MLQLLALHHRVDLWIKSDEKATSNQDLVYYQKQLAHAGIRLLPYQSGYMTEFLAKTYYDIGLFEFYSIAEKYMREFRHCQPHAKIIVDSVDVHFAREMLGAEVGVIELERAEKTRHRELAVYQAADAVITVTEEDCEILLAQGDMPMVYIVPNIMPIRHRATNPRQHNVLFIGGFRHPPNLDGLRWFMQKIWHLVLTNVPEAHFIIIGSYPTDAIYQFGKHPGVTVSGYVPDTTPYLDQAMVSVAPLRYGAGMKGKVNEAMASGVPVVTTSVGAQGLQATSGEHLFIADEPEMFAHAVIELLQNPKRGERIGLAGQQLTAQLCHPESVKQTLRTMLTDLSPPFWQRLLPLRWVKFSIAFHIRRMLTKIM